MLVRQDLIYQIADREFFEKIDFYRPEEEPFLATVKNLLPDTWRIIRNGVWFQCIPPKGEFIGQGWKIHLSSAMKDSSELLCSAVPILLSSQISFKFAMDKWILSLLNGKRWSRGGSGKFVTIYPCGDAEFKEIIENLYVSLKAFKGPYILSDRRYKDSSVIYYRYGSFRRIGSLKGSGEIAPMIVSPSGEHVSDERRPYFVLPAWTQDPFQTVGATNKSSATTTVGARRYEIIKPIEFSNSGGIYLAKDPSTGATVVIKEARPLTGVNLRGQDSVRLLEKEFRILKTVERTGIAPRALEFFQDWEHYFLVLEYVNGVPLGTFSVGTNVCLRVKATEQDFEEFAARFKRIFRQIVAILHVLHQHRIIFGDLSPNNLLVENSTEKIRIIDFEGAFELGKDRPVSLFTPGFAPIGRRSLGQPCFEDDLYALGALIMSFLRPINAIFDLNPGAKRKFASSAVTRSGLPNEVGEIILALMDENPKRRPGLRRVAELLDSTSFLGRRPEKRLRSSSVISPEHILGILNYVKAKADYRRKDRLFPADFKVFETNPLSIAYGATGVAYMLAKVQGSVDPDVTQWILDHDISNEIYPPGLYLGLSGIAWVLLEIGAREEAEKAIRLTFASTLLWNNPDLFNGMAGCGLAYAHFFLETQNELYLEKASEIGEWLIKTSSSEGDGVYWKSSQDVFHGLAHGSSGVALFLVYLYLVSQSERFLVQGQKALDFEFDHSLRNPDGGPSWPYRLNETSPLLPYWRHGSAGVGIAALRYYGAIGETKYLAWAKDIFLDTDRAFAVFPGKFHGMAGIGDFLLDLYQFTGEFTYLNSALRMAQEIELFHITRQQGIAYPGDGLSRISCDLGTGSAGVALFLNRVMTRGPSDFLLDSLLPAKKRPICTSKDEVFSTVAHDNDH
jgi:serine/threonine protein kinase